MAYTMADDQQKNSLHPPPVEHPGRTKSNADAALGAITLPKKAMDTLHRGNFVLSNMETVKRRYRDTYCTLDYFKADDKDECLNLLAEKWGISRERIQKNIAKRLSTMDFPIELLSQVKAIQQIKGAQILLDGQDRRFDLKKDLAGARRNKSGFHDIEQIEEVGEKGTVIKTKRISRPAAIDRIHAKIQDSHESEAKAHSQYIPKPAIQIDIAGKIDFVAEASEEMKEMLKNMRAINAKPTESEVIDADAAS